MPNENARPRKRPAQQLHSGDCGAAGSLGAAYGRTQGELAREALCKGLPLVIESLHQGPEDSVRGSCRRCHPLGRRGSGRRPSRWPGRRGSATWPRCAACRLRGASAVRFLRIGEALRLAVRPRPPVGCAGVLAYVFLDAGEDRCDAVQLEAVRADGRRLGFGRRGVMRVSAAGSLFAGGARVFEAAPGAQGVSRVALAEGPVSALAVPLRFPFEAEDGWRVCGVAGWAGFTPAACAGAAEVVLFPDGDRDGRRAVGRLTETLRAQARTVWVSGQPDGRDVADLWVRCGPSGWRPRSDG